MGMSCFDCHDYMDGYNRGKKEGTIEELKKIKTEIENPKEISLDFFDGLAYAERVIDKELAKLKGEIK